MKNLNQLTKTPILLSDELRGILNGYIMSDGYINARGSLQVQQSKKQEKFVQWLYDKFEPLRTDSPIKEVVQIDKRNNKKTYSKRFYTKSILKEYRLMWYKPYLNEMGIQPLVSSNAANFKVRPGHIMYGRTAREYKKSLPTNIAELFNSSFITLWYAGDGTKTIGYKGAKLEVTRFTPQERYILKKLFKEKFDISVAINRAGKSNSGTEQWTLTIGSADYNKFYALITQMDLIPTLFPHKLQRKP